MTSTKRRRTALFDAPDWADCVALRAIRLGDTLVTRLTVFLSQFGITPLQFNVLRILYVRDAEGEGIPVGNIGGALVAPTADVSRLVDRLEKMELIERVRKSDDRRVVRVRLTPEGFALVEQIHRPLLAHHNALLAGISQAELERVAGALDAILEQLPK